MFKPLFKVFNGYSRGWQMAYAIFENGICHLVFFCCENTEIDGGTTSNMFFWFVGIKNELLRFFDFRSPSLPPSHPTPSFPNTQKNAENQCFFDVPKQLSTPGQFQNDSRGSPQNFRISAKFSDDSLLYFSVFGPQKIAKTCKKMKFVLRSSVSFATPIFHWF